MYRAVTSVRKSKGITSELPITITPPIYVGLSFLWPWHRAEQEEYLKIHKRYTSIITVTHFIIDIEHESSTNLEDWFYSYQDALFGRQFYFKYRTSWQ